MEKLAPIKDFVLIDDISLYIFIFLIMILFCTLIFIALKTVNYFKNRKASKYEIAKEKLKNIDFSNAKQASYKISKYAATIAKTDLDKENLQTLNEKIAKYKYQKNVPEFSEEDKNEFKKFMELCNV